MTKKIIIFLFYAMVIFLIFQKYVDDDYNYQIELMLETTPDNVITVNEQIPMQTINDYGLPVLASQFPYIKGFIVLYMNKIFGLTTLESVKLLFLIDLIIASYSMFLFAFYLFKDQIISMGLGFLYIFLPVSIFPFAWGQISLFTFYAITPLLIYAYIRILSSDRINYYSEISYGLLIGFATLNQPQVMIYDIFLFITVFIFFLLTNLKSKFYQKKMLIQNLIIIIVLISSIIWWIYPVSVIYKDVQLESPATSINNSLPWNSNFWKLTSFSVFSLGFIYPFETYTGIIPFFIFFFIIVSVYPIFQKKLHDTDKLILVFLISYFIYFSLTMGVQIQQFYFNFFYVFLVLILATIIGLCFYRHNFYLSIYFSIFLIFILGWHPSTYKLIFEHIPLFNVFRTPNRFAFMVTFSGVLLFGYFFTGVISKLKMNLYRNLTYTLFTILIILYSSIGINTLYEIATPKIEKNYFNNYYDIISYLNNDNSDFRIAMLPTYTQTGLDIYDVWYDYSPFSDMNGIHWMRELLTKNNFKIADWTTTNLMTKDSFVFWKNMDMSVQQSNWEMFSNRLDYDWSIKYIILLKKYLTNESYQELRMNNNFEIVHENNLFSLVLNKNWKDELITDDITVALDKNYPNQKNRILFYKFKTPDLIDIRLMNDNPITVFLAAPYFDGWYLRNTDGKENQMYGINKNVTLAGKIDDIKKERIYIEFKGKGIYGLLFQYMLWYYPVSITLVVVLYMYKKREYIKNKINSSVR